MAKHKTKECRSCREQIHAHAKVCPQCRAKQGWTLGAKIGLGLLLLFAVPLLLIDSDPDAAKQSSGGTAPPAAASRSAMAPKVERKPAKPRKSEVMEAVELKFTWKKAGFANLMQATFTVKNGSAQDIKDIEIECVHFAPSGTRIDSNRRTIYEVVKAWHSRTFPDFDMGFIHSQVQSSHCGVRDIAVL